MPRKPVDVDQYDRTRNGQPEHVSEYTQMREGAGSTTPPAFEALRRKTRTGDPAVKTETDFQDFEVSAKIVESGVPFPNQSPPDTMQHNHFRITVKNKKSGVSKNFDWFGSAVDYQQGKEELDRNDLLEAFRGVLEEGDMGEYTFEQFADEFGYDMDSRMAEKTWRGVRAQSKKVHALGLEGDDLTMTIEDLGSALGE